MPVSRMLLSLVLVLGVSAAASAQPQWESPDDRDPYDRGPTYQSPNNQNGGDQYQYRQREQYDFRDMQELYLNNGRRVIRECRPFLAAGIAVDNRIFNNPVEGRPENVQAAQLRLVLARSVKRKKKFFCQYAVAGSNGATIFQYSMRCRDAKYHRRSGRFSCKRG